MTIKIGINGFGRMGRLTLRALFDRDDIEIIRVNDPAGNAEILSHLLMFDSIHGRWHHNVDYANDNILINDHSIACSQHDQINETNWSDCDLVIEASGQIKSKTLLQEYLIQGVKRVVVTAPIKEDAVLNIVMGINDHLYDKNIHAIVTAASCTTNCLAPVVKIINDNIGIKHGSITTIHDITNTQTILDAPHKDLRRARAASLNLIPTTTGSATAITQIFPELKGKLNGHAIRVPLANASITDCVFEVARNTTVEEINELLKSAAENELKGIMGYEKRPLVSTDYTSDPRSCIIDALSTMVINNTQVKLYLWYDNEWGYANRAAELVLKVGLADRTG